ncbi:MAG: putative membrane protein SirB2 [Pseudohongiellaceae bacterium]
MALSFGGFFIRGIWMIKQSPMLQERWVKIAPHIIDSLLLASAIIMAAQWHLSPLEQPWLAAKIIALLMYVFLGTIALKRGKSLNIRIAAWIAALVTFGYIVGVAFSKSPFFFLFWPL